MRRRVKLPPIPSKSKSGPVTTRSISNPRNGWTLQQAMSLVSHGYTPARVEQVTGWNAKHLEAQLRRHAGDGGEGDRGHGD